MKEKIVENSVVINGKVLKYKINFGARKRIYLHVKDGELSVRAPYRSSINEVERLVDDKLDWIEKALSKYPKTEIINRSYKEGEKFWILGKEYSLIIENQEDILKKEKVILDDISGKIKVALYKNRNSSINTSKRVEQAINKYYENLADSEISFSMEKMMRQTGLMPESFKVRNFKRAWGNCSSKKVISLNKDLVKYSRDAIDYVCLHELCHLKHMNHSKEFWKLVGTYMPSYKISEKELKNIRI